jgi:hypothetical protein
MTAIAAKLQTTDLSYYGAVAVVVGYAIAFTGNFAALIAA